VLHPFRLAGETAAKNGTGTDGVGVGVGVGVCVGGERGKERDRGIMQTRERQPKGPLLNPSNSTTGWRSAESCSTAAHGLA
jgi:hypothetical protein